MVKLNIFIVALVIGLFLNDQVRCRVISSEKKKFAAHHHELVNHHHLSQIQKQHHHNHDHHQSTITRELEDNTLTVREEQIACEDLFYTKAGTSKADATVCLNRNPGCRYCVELSETYKVSKAVCSSVDCVVPTTHKSDALGLVFSPLSETVSLDNHGIRTHLATNIEFVPVQEMDLKLMSTLKTCIQDFGSDDQAKRRDAVDLLRNNDRAHEHVRVPGYIFAQHVRDERTALQQTAQKLEDLTLGSMNFVSMERGGSLLVDKVIMFLDNQPNVMHYAVQKPAPRDKKESKKIHRQAFIDKLIELFDAGVTNIVVAETWISGSETQALIDLLEVVQAERPRFTCTVLIERQSLGYNAYKTDSFRATGGYVLNKCPEVALEVPDSQCPNNGLYRKQGRKTGRSTFADPSYLLPFSPNGNAFNPRQKALPECVDRVVLVSTPFVCGEDVDVQLNRDGDEAVNLFAIKHENLFTLQFAEDSMSTRDTLLWILRKADF